VGIDDHHRGLLRRRRGDRGKAGADATVHMSFVGVDGDERPHSEDRKSQSECDRGSAGARFESGDPRRDRRQHSDPRRVRQSPEEVGADVRRMDENHPHRGRRREESQSDADDQPAAGRRIADDPP
jgi:hypothetical protein